MKAIQKWILLLASMLMSSMHLNCSDGTLLNSANQKTAPSLAQDGSSDEVDQPQSIAGAFLTCRSLASTETGMTATSSEQHIGCVVIKDNTKMALASSVQKYLAYKDENGSSVAIKTQEAINSLYWHVFATLPKVANGTLTMSISDKNINAKFDFTAQQLSEVNLNLISSSAYYDATDGASDTWSGVVPNTICQNGVINSAIDSIGTVVPIDFNKTITHENKSLNSQCFKQFNKIITAITGTTDGPIDWAQEGEGCLFVKILTQSQKFYIIFSKSDSQKLGLTKANLVAAAQKSPCP